LGFTSGKEYAELEWPIDILIAVVWVAYAIVFFGTIVKRKVTHIYVANWFYGGFILPWRCCTWSIAPPSRSR
jgi:cytochrome c oxidase cbb3-type subunit 1